MTPDPTRAVSGAQTLARGLAALRAVASSPTGLSVQEVGDALGVHRTIAYRMLSTLADAGLVSRAEDGRYRGAIGLLELRAGGYETLKHAAEPVLADLADRLGATASLIVAVESEAIALLVVSPRAARYHVAFSAGSRHPLEHGAAGHALLAGLAPQADEDPAVTEARSRGYAVTYGEVEPGAWGLAAPIRIPETGLVACVNVISFREDLINDAIEPVIACARQLEARLGSQH